MIDGLDTDSGIQRLLDIMARLRDPQTGCPWDLQQTFASIAPYTIEEAYEVVEAIDSGDLGALRDELGDLLLQVVFHSRMAQEQGAFGFADVVTAISDKLVRRHPHVFAQSTVTGIDDQSADWERLKRQERDAAGDNDRSALAGITRGLPEWHRARKLQSRAAKAGFDWPDPGSVVAKLHEEIGEVMDEFDAVRRDPADAAAQDRLEDEIGDLLFVAANLARHAKVDTGSAMRRANTKFERRFRLMETLAEAEGNELATLPLARQEHFWNKAKACEAVQHPGDSVLGTQGT